MKETMYAPPQEWPFAAQPLKLPKDNQQAYRSYAPVQNPKLVDVVFECSMKSPCLTLSHEELLSISAEICQCFRNAVTPKCIATDHPVATNTFEEAMPFTSAELPSVDSIDKTSPPPGVIVVPDIYETYLHSTKDPSPKRLVVAKNSHALRTMKMFVNNVDEVDCVIDPGCQIIAMSETVCHHLGIVYDPEVRLLMQSANGEVDESLGLARNVPCQIGEITLFLQMHIIRSPAYDILIGRPFDVLTASIVKNYPNEEQTITIVDPNTRQSYTIPTFARGEVKYHPPGECENFRN